MKILVAGAISDEALERLGERHDVVYVPGASEDVLRERVVGCRALVFRSGVEITASVLDSAPDLEVIVRAGSGFDNIDLDRLGQRTLHFFRVPGPGARAVAEMSFTLMLALSRQLRFADREWRAGRWVKAEVQGRLMTGKTLGIVGAGNIGTRTGELGVGWGMTVLGCVETPADEDERRLRSHGIALADFDEVIRQSDYISVHTPLQDSTRGLIGAAELAAMKRGVVVVNLARGGVVDEPALLHALRSGHVAGAGLDVHVAEGHGNISPFAELDNVILTPHIGANTIDTQREIGEVIVKCIEHAEANPPAKKAVPANFVVM